MIKFIHKKHINTKRPEARFVIYYSVSDIVLGLLLVGLTTFFAVSYWQNNLSGSRLKSACVPFSAAARQTYPNPRY